MELIRTNAIDCLRSHPEAVKRYANGESLTWTTNIAEEIVCGYGQINEYGLFEYPLWFSGIVIQ